MPLPQAALDTARMRKFRGLAEAAELRVEGPFEGRTRLCERRCVQGGSVRCRFRCKGCERQFQLLVLLGDFSTMVAIVLGHAPQQIAERRHPIAGLFRKVSAAEEGRL